MSDYQRVTMESQRAEIDALKNTIKFMKLEHNVAIQEKDIQILMLQKENGFQILNLEHEIKILKGNFIAEKEIKGVKRKKKDDSKQIDHPEISFNEFFMETEDLIRKGIARFFRRQGESKGDFYNYYHGWFQSMAGRIGKNNPIIHEEYVLVKVKCKDPSTGYSIFSDEKNQFNDRYTNLNIFHKGWKHDTASVLILHPININKSTEMGRGEKCDSFHQWKVDSILKEYRGEDDFAIVMFLKTKKQ